MIHTTSIESTTATGAARRFSEDDIPGVVELYRRVRFPRNEGSTAALVAYRRYLARVFLDELWDGSGLGSIVYEGPGGRITGFLGVVPRWMSLGRARHLAAVSARPLVEERGRGDRVAAELSVALLRGPQDLSIHDGPAGDTTRAVWERLGGRAAPVHSQRWSRGLRPEAFPGGRVSGSPKSGSVVGAVIGRLMAALDRPTPGALAAEEMCPGTFVEQMPALVGPRALRADDEERVVRWSLERVSTQPEWARTEGVLLRDRDGRPVGAYHHAVDERRVDHVLQLVAAPTREREVVEHLLRSASERGATAVEGRGDGQLAAALTRCGATLRPDEARVLVHSKRSEIRAAFERGEAVFSRLQGEACLRSPAPVG